MRASSEWPVTVMCEVNYIEYVVVIVGQFTVVTSLLPVFFSWVVVFVFDYLSEFLIL